MASVQVGAQIMECSDCTPIRKDRDDLLQENRRLERELHKADLQIGRLCAEVKALRAKVPWTSRLKEEGGNHPVS